ncbi:peptidase inhibitor family I36 protein [Devosia sp.]|uniref:peptidase inhibitor family I36 protein n=1 Tax=Devosia sp. TaxID=1871048 RepID=UPI002FC5F868
MKPVRIGLFSALLVLAGTAVAMAQQTVTITANIDAYKGPGLEFGYAGTVRANTPVTLDHCESNFCMVYYGTQTIWVEQQYVAQAPQPQPQPQPQPNPGWPWPQPLPQPPRPAPPPVFDDVPGACFYSERNFRGSSFCVDEGESFARLRNWNNAIRSVEVFGGVRVDLCSDSNYRGNCVTLRRDTSRLPSELDRKASSIDVY